MKKVNVRWQLVSYDIIVFIAVCILLLFIYRGTAQIAVESRLAHISLAFVCIFAARFVGRVYQQIWRYGGIQCYIRLLIVDGIAFFLNVLVAKLLPIQQISAILILGITCMNLLAVLAMRMMYRYAYKCGNSETIYGRFLNVLLRIFAGAKVEGEKRDELQKIKIAIIGAGRTGVSLADELLTNPSAAYTPKCFVDVSKDKANRSINGIPVILEDDNTFERLKDAEVQEVVFAIPSLEGEARKDLYERYLQVGYKIKVYDYPVMQSAGSRRHLREFDIEELLFRKPIVIHDDKTGAYYKDKIVLITGGGGSIGSELCRQLAKMEPRQIIILDIYENGAYDI